jgi:hypothetical protein
MRPRLQRLLEDIEPRDGCAAGGRGHESGKDAHGGGFAGTVRPEKTHDLALADLEVQISDRRLAGVTLGQIFNLNHRKIINQTIAA